MANRWRIRRGSVWVGLWMAILCAGTIQAVAVEGARNHQSIPPEIDRLARNLLLQIDLAYRHDRQKHDARIRTIHQALDAWYHSSRRKEDDARIQEWLQDSIRRSSPDRRKPLLPVPMFHRLGQQVHAHQGIQPNVLEPGRSASMPRTDIWPGLSIPVPMAFQLAGKPAWPTRPFASVSEDANTMLLEKLNKPARVPKIQRSFPGFLTASSAIPRRHADPSKLTFLTAAPSISNTTDSVGINRNELVSRLIGYRLGIRTIESRLTSNETSSAQELALAAQELESLAEQRDLLMLYCMAIGADTSLMETSMPSTTNAWKYLHQAIAARQAALNRPNRLLDEEEREIERSILAAIQRRISEHKTAAQKNTD